MSFCFDCAAGLDEFDADPEDVGGGACCAELRPANAVHKIMVSAATKTCRNISPEILLLIGRAMVIGLLHYNTLERSTSFHFVPGMFRFLQVAFSTI